MATERRERLYLDSPVIGGYYDSEFAEDSQRIVGYARSERITVLISEVVIQEILKAPAQVQDVLLSIPSSVLERVELTEEIFILYEA